MFIKQMTYSSWLLVSEKYMNFGHFYKSNPVLRDKKLYTFTRYLLSMDKKDANYKFEMQLYKSPIPKFRRYIRFSMIQYKTSPISKEKNPRIILDIVLRNAYSLPFEDENYYNGLKNIIVEIYENLESKRRPLSTKDFNAVLICPIY